MKLLDITSCFRVVIPASAGGKIQVCRCSHSSLLKKVQRTDFRYLFTGLLVLAGVYTACVQASITTAYYVLDADFSHAEASVISLEDGNVISAGSTQLYLDQGESGVIPVADLVQGTKVEGTGAFTLGNSVNGTDLPNPGNFAGSLFSIPHKSGSHRYLLLSPDENAKVTIRLNGDTTTSTLNAGQVHTLEIGDSNGRNKSGVIISNIPILVQHKGYEGDDARYSYPVPPAALEAWGFRSKRILVGAPGEQGADIDLYASDGDSTGKSISGNEWKEISVGDSESEGRGDAVHIISSQPVSAVQYDDGDGNEATAFFSSDYLATHYVLPVASQYVAVLCTQANTVITLYEDASTADERVCHSDGTVPGKAYFGSSSDGVHMAAGTRIEATKPVYLIYEDAGTNDEKNLLGFDLRGPEITVVNPGDQGHLETRDVLLQIKAASSEEYPLVYSATGLPPGLAIDPDSGLVSGQVLAGAAGSHSVTITVDDGIAEASVSFQWTVTGGNIGIETIIRSGDSWKYLDDGTNQGAQWRDPAADDSTWREGPSQLGFGEGDEATVVSYGGDADHKNITTYFRKEFVLADSKLATDLALRLMRDDGAVVYLNGHEVLRSNMSNGTIDYRDRASERVNKTRDRDISRKENIFLDYFIDPAWLVDGVNLLAVEVHLYKDKSSDLSFDLELSAGIDLIEDIIPPATLNPGMISFSTSRGNMVITGQAGAAEAFARITIATATGETVTAVANADGSFRVMLGTDTGENVSITLADRHGNTGESINMTAVGSTAGSFDVSPQGAGTYTLPLTIPPGISGMQPALSLAYNSQAGSGLLGPGWSLQGLSAISRCGATRVQDGFIDGVDFDANDRYCLDGQRLIAVSGAYGANLTEYRTEIDSFSKIVSYTEAGSAGVAYFRVWTKAGQVLEYGRSTDSRIEATSRSDNAVLIWAVNRIEDTVGNYITTTYSENSQSGEYYPLRIDYTGNEHAGMAPLASVSFAYSYKPATKGYMAGSSIESSKVMSGISTQVGSAVVRNYNFTYRAGTATGRKRLASIQECSPTACLPAHVFGWQDMAGTGFNAVTASSHNGTGFATRTAWTDVNGDGLVDWVRAGSSAIQVRLSRGDGSFGSMIGSAHGKSYQDSHVSWVDVNGDGLADWVRAGATSTKVRLSKGDGSFGQIIESAHGENYQDSRVSWADVNGDGLADWVRAGTSFTKVRLSRGDGTFGAMINSAHGASNQYSEVSWADINGDGLADWVRAGFDRTKARLSNGDGGFGPMIDSVHGENYQYSRVAWADINGDGLADWVRAGSDRTRARLSKGDGTFGPMTDSAHGASSLDSRVSWVDINADGLADWVRAGADRTQVRLSRGDGSFGVLAESLHGPDLYTDVSWVDINGDGLADWVRSGSAEIQARLHAGVRPDLIDSINKWRGSSIPSGIYAPDG